MDALLNGPGARSGGGPLFECFVVVGLEAAPSSGGAGGSSALRAVVRRAVGMCPGGGLGALESVKGGAGALAEFAFPALRFERPVATLAPRCYVAALTLGDGSFLYAFCLKQLPAHADREASPRYDLGRRLPEVLMVVSPNFEVDLYLRLLECLAARRVVDPASSEALLDALRASEAPAPGQSLRVKSSSLGVVCEYKLTRPRVGERAHVSQVLRSLTPKMLHYVVGAVMCEQRVIFLSRSETVLSLVIHGVMALLVPFAWQHMFVPLMPEHLLEYLGAPSPYLVGVLREHEPALQRLPLGGVVVADLDRNEIRSSETLLPFGLPPQSSAGLPRGATGSIYADQERERVSQVFGAELVALYNRAGGGAKGSQGYVDERELRSLWLAFNIAVFGHAARLVRAGQPVDKDRFLQYVADPDMRTFCKVFCHTQMFNDFCERLAEGSARVPPPQQHQGAGAGAVGGSRKNAVERQRQLAEDAIWRAVLQQVGPDAPLADLRKAARGVLPERTCGGPDSAAVAEVLEIVPAQVRSALLYSPDKDEQFEKLARRSYDVYLAAACNHAVWRRVVQATSAGSADARNLRAATNAVLLLRYLLSGGSEVVLAGAYRHIDDLARLLLLLRQNAAAAAAETSKAKAGGSAPLAGDPLRTLRRAARDCYQVLMDTPRLVWERSPKGGHRLFVAVRERQEADEVSGLRCASFPIPRFRDLHEGALDPRAPVRPAVSHQPHAPPSRPQRPAMAPADNVLVHAREKEKAVSPAGPPPQSQQKSPASAGSAGRPSVGPPPTYQAAVAMMSASGPPPPPPPPRIFDTASPPPPPPPRIFESALQDEATLGSPARPSAPGRAPPQRAGPKAGMAVTAPPAVAAMVAARVAQSAADRPTRSPPTRPPPTSEGPGLASNSHGSGSSSERPAAPANHARPAPPPAPATGKLAAGADRPPPPGLPLAKAAGPATEVDVAPPIHSQRPAPPPAPPKQQKQTQPTPTPGLNKAEPEVRAATRSSMPPSIPLQTRPTNTQGEPADASKEREHACPPRPIQPPLRVKAPSEDTDDADGEAPASADSTKASSDPSAPVPRKVSPGASVAAATSPPAAGATGTASTNGASAHVLGTQSVKANAPPGKSETRASPQAPGPAGAAAPAPAPAASAVQSAKATFQPAKAPLEQQEHHQAPMSAVQAAKAKFQPPAGAAPAAALMPPEPAQLSSVQAARARLEHSGTGAPRPEQAGDPAGAAGNVAKLAGKFNNNKA